MVIDHPVGGTLRDLIECFGRECIKLAQQLDQDTSVTLLLLRIRLTDLAAAAHVAGWRGERRVTLEAVIAAHVGAILAAVGREVRA